MTELQEIQDDIKTTYDGSPWHGPSLKNALRGVSATAADTHPPGSIHSIWQLVAHCRGWTEVIVKRLEGQVSSYPAGGNFPSPKTVTESAWQREQNELDAVMKRLLSLVGGMRDHQLDEKAVGKRVTNRVMLRGNVAHTIYHTGQIVLLKKTVRELTRNHQDAAHPVPHSVVSVPSR